MYIHPYDNHKRVEVFPSTFPVVGLCISGDTAGHCYYHDAQGAVWEEHRVMGGRGLELADEQTTVDYVKKIVALYHKQHAQQEHR